MRKTITLLGVLVLMVVAGWNGGTVQAQNLRTVVHCGDVLQQTLAKVEIDHVYELTMNAGQTVTVSMVALEGNLDPYLVLYDFYPSQNPLAYDDDSAGGLDAQITFTAPQTRTYYIVATRYGRETESSSGSYQLDVNCGGGSSTSPGKNGSSGNTAMAGSGFCGYYDQDSISNQRYDVVYELPMTAGQTITVNMNSISGNLDPYLMVYDSYPSQNPLASNDDGGSNYNAELTFTAPQTRTYTLVATRYGHNTGSSTGTYELTISCGNTAMAGSGFCGSTAQDVLSAQDYEHVYELPMTAGQTITVNMNSVSGNLDPYLVVYDIYPGQNPLASNDDGGSNYNAALTFTAPQTRTYYVVATRYGRDTGGTSGSYEITIDCNGSNASGGVNVGGNTLSTIVGSNFCNYSSGGDIDNQYYENIYELTMQAGQTMNAGMYMMSENLDSYLMVYDFYPSQNPLVYDDDSAGGLDAELSFTAPRAGTYYLVATRYGRDIGSSSGSYLLTIGCGGSSGISPEGNQSSESALGVGQPPSFGAVTLQSGFANDPYEVEMVAGGTLLASSYASSNCAGYIASNPDFQLDYQTGQYALTLYFDTPTSDQDTTLVVLAPDLSWYCDDDSGGDLQPWMQLGTPMSGQYLIWVGTYGGDLQNGTLVITERDMMPR